MANALSFFIAFLSIGVAFGNQQTASLQTSNASQSLAQNQPQTQTGSPSITAQPKKPAHRVELGIAGIMKYAQLKKIKDHLMMTLPQGSTFYEKRVSRGNVTMALNTSMRVDVLSQRLAGLPLDQFKLNVTKVDREDKILNVRIE